ncbi:hypothetical protein ANN_24906 [Periplaneta americana]|uniref:Uncharacterized protein n=1 Tax=Periplaneta americana TaxID=6978 RepID=A0ABQ8RZW5_PERAM|nr:hypothetical protein ANN_24906 [Periplaneta americana]
MLVNRFKRTGSFLDEKRSGKPQTSANDVPLLQHATERSPGASTHRLSNELDIPRTTVWRVLRFTLHLQVLHHLEQEDYAARQAMCHDLLEAIANENLMNHILLSDEATFHNCGIWADEQPNDTYEWQKGYIQNYWSIHHVSRIHSHWSLQLRQHLRHCEFKTWCAYPQKGKRAVLFEEVPAANSWIIKHEGISSSETREMLKMIAMVAPCVLLSSMNGHVGVIHERLQTVYGEEVMSCQMVGRWCCMFSEGRQSVEDEGQSGRPSTSTNENNIARVQDMVLVARHITVSEVVSTLHIGCAQAHHMLHDVLGYRKVCKMGAEKPDPGSQECKNGNQPRSHDAKTYRLKY